MLETRPQHKIILVWPSNRCKVWGPISSWAPAIFNIVWGVWNLVYMLPQTGFSFVIITVGCLKLTPKATYKMLNKGYFFCCPKSGKKWAFYDPGMPSRIYIHCKKLVTSAINFLLHWNMWKSPNDPPFYAINLNSKGRAYRERE